MKDFETEVADRLAANGVDERLQLTGREFMHASTLPKYSYNFDWLGRPIIQYPQDIVATQEIIWRVKPDLIIETGIAHGGSLVLSASMLALLDYSDAVERGGVLDPGTPMRRVLGIDIDIRAHNRAAIQRHPLAGRIDRIAGSSTAPEVVSAVTEAANAASCVLVMLDSNHTHEHVLAELIAYSPLVSIGSYCIVFDTVVEDLPAEFSADRPWGPGNNPRTAVNEFLKSSPGFVVDTAMDNKLVISVAAGGYLRKVS